MSEPNRRQFIAQASAGVAALHATQNANATPTATPADSVDFRYSPLDGQAAFCFPDDPYKSLVGSSGELRCGHPGTNTNIDAFSSIVRFSTGGMEPDRVTRQELEAPGVPIVHTWIQRPAAEMEIITFATNRSGEGRVDNVIVRFRSRISEEVHIAPLVHVETRGRLEGVPLPGALGTRVIGPEGECFLLADRALALFPAFDGFALGAPALRCGRVDIGQAFFRFPQQRQMIDALIDGLKDPEGLLAEARGYWATWKPFNGQVRWELPGRYQKFLTACARNIVQAREIKNGRKTFQVGPTCYRGLWIVDGNFILEAARYLGYDTEAQQGLQATWSHQFPDGGVFAAAPGQHWKDTAIAMFTLVRQAELSGDWTYFRAMVPNLLLACDFLRRVRDRGRTEDSANGRYGLLARGFGDGGLNGLRSEFTNTVWTLAGLRAVLTAANRQGFGEQFSAVQHFHDELRSAFFAAARKEMRRHANGFDYLPMLMKEDPVWNETNAWDRPQPQVAQWALSHAIYPGLVFEPNDPVVQGHIALMQACTREDVPAGTGWLPHDSLWTYNAPFVSHVYLWAGANEWASRTFAGFLNHASPLYCWREEQPLRGGLVSGYWGDMPHNWASAECILYLRHMLALEDGSRLRLLSGWNLKEEVALEQTPTRFGRLDLRLKRQGQSAWSLEFSRNAGTVPSEIELPTQLPDGASFVASTGAKVERRRQSILVEPTATMFSVQWKI